MATERIFTIRSCFNEFAALTSAAYGLVGGVKAGTLLATTAIGVLGLGTAGVIPGIIGLACVVGATIGGTMVSYRGAQYYVGRGFIGPCFERASAFTRAVFAGRRMSYRPS